MVGFIRRRLAIRCFMMPVVVVIGCTSRRYIGRKSSGNKGNGKVQKSGAQGADDNAVSRANIWTFICTIGAAYTLHTLVLCSHASHVCGITFKRYDFQPLLKAVSFTAFKTPTPHLHKVALTKAFYAVGGKKNEIVWRKTVAASLALDRRGIDPCDFGMSVTLSWFSSM